MRQVGVRDLQAGTILQVLAEHEADSRHLHAIQVLSSVPALPDLAQGRVGGLVDLDFKDVDAVAYVDLVVRTASLVRLFRLRGEAHLSNQGLEQGSVHRFTL